MPKRHEPHDLVAEIIRRAELSEDRYVIRVSDPPTPFERLQLLSAHLQRRPHVIMPHPCRSFDEWHERCRRLFGPQAPLRAQVPSQEQGTYGTEGTYDADIQGARRVRSGQDAPRNRVKRKPGSVNVRFAPKATNLLRRREMS